MNRCVPGAHLVRKGNVHDHKIRPEMIIAYKHCCMRKNNPKDEIEPDQNVRICTSCWALIMKEMKNPTQPVYNPERYNYFPYRSAVIKQGECFLCNAPSPTFQIPFEARVDFFVKTNIFLENDTKCCRNHLTTDLKEFKVQPHLFSVETLEDIISMKPQETAEWFYAIRTTALSSPSGMLNRILALEAEDFRQITAITRDQFDELCAIVCEYRSRGLICRPISILLFLMKMRNACYLNFLKSLFGFKTCANVSQQIRTAREALKALFVPHHLGPAAFPRPHCLANVNELSKILHLDSQNTENCVLIVDGTYVYIPKSSNFLILRRSYSQHKGRHLVKFTMVVFPNGKILDVQGPYFCDSRNNDASTLRHSLQNDVNRIREWLQPGDVFVVDRGYRDAVVFLESLGLQVSIPHCIPHGLTQLPTQQANESRIVTKTRWIVESVNGRISQIFKFFGRPVHARNVEFVGDYFRICCALLNAFYPPITLTERSQQVGNRMLELRDTSNRLMEYLSARNLLNFRIQRPWRDMDDIELEDFPRMSLDDLYDLALGVFQVRMASGYHGGQETFRFQVFREESDLLRVKLWSRHATATFYYVFIRFLPGQNGSQAIQSWYCSCKTGARTVGMCSHTCSILWYLCYARYEPHVPTPSSRNLDLILDAAERHGSMNVVPDSEAGA